MAPASPPSAVDAALRSKSLEPLVELGDRLASKVGNLANDAVEALVAAPVVTVRAFGRLLESRALEVLDALDSDPPDPTFAPADPDAVAHLANLRHRALAAAAVLVRRALDHCGAAAPDAFRPAAVLLHDRVLLSVPGRFPHGVVDAVSAACEHWWLSEKPGRELLVPKTISHLVVQALSSGKGSEVKRLHAASRALELFEWRDDESVASLKRLLLRCAFAPQFLRVPDGRRFLSFLFTLDPAFTRDLMAIVRNQIPAGRRSVLDAYGDVLFRAWRDAGTECMDEIERAGVQDLAERAILASTPRMNANVRAVLDGFHARKARGGVDAALLRLYSPVLFRALSAANPAVRRNACALLVDAFPLQDPYEDVEETDALLSRQMGHLRRLMEDDSPAVRAAAAEGACRVLNAYWELIPARTTASILDALVNDTARDASAVSVRVAALEGLARLVDNPMAQPVLKAALPRLAPLIGDSAARVRCALADVLLAVKSVRSMHFYDIVPLEHLLLALGGGGGDAVAARVTRLLTPTYMPSGKSPGDAATRLAALVARDPDAAAAMCRHAVKEGTPVHVAEATCRAVASRLAASGEREESGEERVKGGKREESDEERVKGGLRDRDGTVDGTTTPAEKPLSTAEWTGNARTLAALVASIRDEAVSAASAAEKNDGDGDAAIADAPLTASAAAAMVAAAPTRAGRAHALRAAAAAAAVASARGRTFTTSSCPRLHALRRRLLDEVRALESAPAPGSEDETALAASLSALCAWGDADALADVVGGALLDAADEIEEALAAADADAERSLVEEGDHSRRQPLGARLLDHVSAWASRADAARRCVRLLLRDDDARAALIAAGALEPLDEACRAHAAALASDPRAAAAAPAAAADAVAARAKIAAHLALAEGVADDAAEALAELVRWAEDDEDVPAVVLASTAGACSEYAELGLLENREDVAVAAASFGTRAFASLVEGGDPSDGGARARGVNAAFARFAVNLAAPRADGVVAKRALASAEATAKALATRGASSDEAAAALAPALPTLLRGMLRRRRKRAGREEDADAPVEWLRPVAVNAAATLERTRAKERADGDETSSSRGLAEATLASARLPATRAALAAAFASLAKGAVKDGIADVAEGATAMLARLDVGALPAAAVQV